MEDEHTKILWGSIIAGITGLYGLFVKHVIRHVDKDEFAKLKDNVQYKDNCDEIVKRTDGNLADLKEDVRAVSKKLDTVLMHLEKK